MAIVIGGAVLVRWISRYRPMEYLVGAKRFVELTNLAELDDVFESTNRQSNVLFLHDPWCPVSALATRQMAQLDRSIMAVDVSRQRDLSREIERRTGIRHESPRAIVINGGVAVWDASHASIDSRSISLVMGEANDGDPPGSFMAGQESAP